MFTKADGLAIRQGLGELAVSASLDEDIRARFSQYFDFYKFDHQFIEAITHSAGVVCVAEFEVVTQCFRQASNRSRGTVILLHGYFDHVGLYKHIIEYCLQRQLDVVAFDLPGHGLSSGVPASIDSFSRYRDALLAVLDVIEQESLAQPWSLVGQSTGGAVIIDSLLNNKIESSYPIEKFITLAPLLRPFAWKTSRVLFALSRLFLKSSMRNFSENSHDQEFLKFIRNEDPLQSRRLMRDWVSAMILYQKAFAAAPVSNNKLQIIQGTSDTTVDWQYNLKKLGEKFPSSTVYKISGARHHLVNESQQYREQVFYWLDIALEIS